MDIGYTGVAIGRLEVTITLEGGQALSSLDAHANGSFSAAIPHSLGEMEQDCQFRKSSLSSEVRIVSIGPSVPRACLQMGLTTGCSDAAINYITRSRRQGLRGWSLARPGFGINGLRRSPAR